MAQDNSRNQFSFERGESSSVGDKSEGKTPLFGTFGSVGTPPPLQTAQSGVKIGEARSVGAGAVMGNYSGAERNGVREPPRDRNGYYMFTPKEVEEILYLQPSDHPGMILVTMPLTGTNFLHWSRSIRRALGARSKLEILDGFLSEPSLTCAYYKAWVKTDYMISCWIINSITKELVSAFSHINNTRRLWEALNQRFGRRNGPNVYKIQKEIVNHRQGNLSVLMYFNELVTLWDELDMVLPPLGCICEARERSNKIEQEIRLMQFLVGLHDGYDQVRSQILLMNPLPTVDEAYSMIIQVEDQKGIIEDVAAVDTRLAMQIGKAIKYRNGGNTDFKRRVSKEERQRMRCTHCNGVGHEVSECFKLNGYPDWYKELKKG